MLAMDIGNSNLRIARFVNTDIAEKLSLPLEQVDPTRLSRLFKNIHPKPEAGETLWVASVVPALNALTAELAQAAGLDPVFLNPAKDRIISHTLLTPHTTGVDRLLAALAAWQLIFKPNHNGGIVVQGGSAVTVDLVNASGTFCGGYILPGPKLWLKGLSQAAQLPDFSTEEVDWENLLPGNDTKSAMLNGLAAALPGAVSEAIACLRKTLPAEAPLVVTGGWADRLTKRLENLYPLNMPDLTLHGIRLYANSHK